MLPFTIFAKKLEMPESLSPKKYIETKVRSLPIYKCLINADWEESSLANVIVMRKHINGQVSGAIYLVDLQCLGVKDTSWFFNEVETKMMERFEGAADAPVLETINYELAHNIVYAGHDFAMEYDIHPHPDFKTSRFVLEEDDEKIPMLDITTGYGKEGIPHLMAYQAGQYADALAKLKKNAGEGNYLYTIGMLAEEDEFENDEDENKNEDALSADDKDTEESVVLSDIGVGMLTLLNVQEVRMEDLSDEAQITARGNREQMICFTELLLRTLPDAFFADEPEWADDEWNFLEHMHPLPNGTTNADFEEWMTFEKEDDAFESEGDEEGVEQSLENLALKFIHNPLVATMLLSNAIANKEEKAKKWLAQWKPMHGHIPLFQLLEAFNAVMTNNDTGAFNYIILNNSLKDAFVTIETFSPLEIGVFHALHTIKNARLQNLVFAVQHYYFAAATDFVHILYLPMMSELLPPLQVKVMEEMENKNGGLNVD